MGLKDLIDTSKQNAILSVHLILSLVRCPSHSQEFTASNKLSKESMTSFPEDWEPPKVDWEDTVEANICIVHMGGDRQQNKSKRTIQILSQTLPLLLSQFKLVYQEQWFLFRSLKTGFYSGRGRDLLALTLLLGSLPPTPVHCPKLIHRSGP